MKYIYDIKVVKKVKIINFFCLLLATVMVTSCDYLDEKPLNYLQPEERFQEEAQMELAVHECYSYLNNGYNNVGGSFFDAATNDAVYRIEVSTVNKLARAQYTAGDPGLDIWDRCYSGISQSFLVEENLHYMNIPKGSSVSDPEAYFESKRKEFGSEAKMVRAYLYFELLRMYGGVPLVKSRLPLGTKLTDVTRATFAEVVNYIVQLCNEAAEDHPSIINTTPGRWGKGAAKAIKAKTLAYAASDLYHVGVESALNGYMQDNRLTARLSAAEALDDFMKYTEFDLANTYDMFFMAPNNAQFKKEYIVYKGEPQRNDIEGFLFTPSTGGNGGVYPTQEFVDAFDNADGTIYFPSVTADGSQYTGRDPRLDKIVIYNGAKVRGSTTINTYTGTDETLDGFSVVHQKSTRTGYYLRKFANYGTVNFDNANPGVTYHINPIIRYADILLLYAEVMNELYGPDDADKFNITALEAINKVRARGGITTPLPADISQNELRSRIVNERRIELCFEEQRYFDLKRWKIGINELNSPVHGTKITREGDEYMYQKVVVDDSRKFTEPMYFAPIPYNEQLKLGIEQNKGW